MGEWKVVVCAQRLYMGDDDHRLWSKGRSLMSFTESLSSYG